VLSKAIGFLLGSRLKVRGPAGGATLMPCVNRLRLTQRLVAKGFELSWVSVGRIRIFSDFNQGTITLLLKRFVAGCYPWRNGAKASLLQE
jgi:hypothetical protein